MLETKHNLKRLKHVMSARQAPVEQGKLGYLETLYEEYCQGLDAYLSHKSIHYSCGRPELGSQHPHLAAPTHL